MLRRALALALLLTLVIAPGEAQLRVAPIGERADSVTLELLLRKLAKEIITLRERAKEIDKLRSGPPASAPAGTAVRPSPVPLASDEMTDSEYRRQMATLPDDQRAALFHRKQAGSLRVRRG